MKGTSQVFGRTSLNLDFPLLVRWGWGVVWENTGMVQGPLITGHQPVTIPWATWLKQFVRFIHVKLLFFPFPDSILCKWVTKASTDSCWDSQLSPIWRGEELHMLLGICFKEELSLLPCVYLFYHLFRSAWTHIFILDLGLYSNTTLFILFLKLSRLGYWELFQVGVCVPSTHPIRVYLSTALLSGTSS